MYLKCRIIVARKICYGFFIRFYISTMLLTLNTYRLLSRINTTDKERFPSLREFYKFQNKQGYSWAVSTSSHSKSTLNHKTRFWFAVNHILPSSHFKLFGCHGKPITEHVENPKPQKNEIKFNLFYSCVLQCKCIVEYLPFSSSVMNGRMPWYCNCSVTLLIFDRPETFMVVF